MEIIEMRSFPSGRTSSNSILFTTYTLAKNLGWVVQVDRNESGQQPSKRFYAAFKVLTELILPEAVSPKELEGMTQKDVVTVADAASVIARKAQAKGNNSEVARRKAAKEAIKEVQSVRAEKDKENLAHARAG